MFSVKVDKASNTPHNIMRISISGIRFFFLFLISTIIIKNVKTN